MADLMDGAEFWLPAKFLTDDKVVMKKGNLKNGTNDTELLVSSHSFPTEFPCEFNSLDSVLSSPVDSVVGSTETESSDEDEFLAGLTRRLAYSVSQKLTVPTPTLYLDKNEKNGALASSPRSTLSELGYWSSSSNGSPNGPSSQVPSPPTTPFCTQNDTWDLIYAAAGQVARLKMSNEVPKYTNFNHGSCLSKTQNHSFMKNTSNHSLFLDHKALPFNHAQTNQVIGRQGKASNLQALQQQQHFQTRTRNNVAGGRTIGLSQTPWLQLQSQQKQPQIHHGSSTRAMFLGNGSGVGGIKRESAGTGVFIPRRYGNNNNNNLEPRKKSGCSNVLPPAKVVQTLDDIYNPSFASNFDAMVLARRNAVLAQARRNYRQDGGLNLPQEWTY